MILIAPTLTNVVCLTGAGRDVLNLQIPHVSLLLLYYFGINFIRDDVALDVSKFF